MCSTVVFSVMPAECLAGEFYGESPGFWCGLFIVCPTRQFARHTSDERGTGKGSTATA